jgi:hypothetical protein
MNRSLLPVMWHRNPPQLVNRQMEAGEWNIGKFEAQHFADPGHLSV